MKRRDIGAIIVIGILLIGGVLVFIKENSNLKTNRAFIERRERYLCKIDSERKRKVVEEAFTGEKSKLTNEESVFEEYKYSEVVLKRIETKEENVLTKNGKEIYSVENPIKITECWKNGEAEVDDSYILQGTLKGNNEYVNIYLPFFTQYNNKEISSDKEVERKIQLHKTFQGPKEDSPNEICAYYIGVNYDKVTFQFQIERYYQVYEKSGDKKIYNGEIKKYLELKEIDIEIPIDNIIEVLK